MALLIFYVLLALGVSFLCSILEAVLLSVTPSFVTVTERENPKLGERIKALKKDIDRPLAAILSLNTIAHTVGATGAGAQAASVFGSAYLGIFSGILTLLILVLSEIIPKTIGALYWRQLVSPTARILGPLTWSMAPLVWMSQGITRWLARGRESSTVSREEVSAMAELAGEEGVFHEAESRIIGSLLGSSTLTAREIMTPRTVIFALPDSTRIRDVLAKHPKMVFSRIPVYEGSLDQVTGYVLKDDVLLHAATGRPDMELKEIRRDMLVVPATMDLHELFRRLLGTAEHIALVVDEYGGTAGLATLEDLFETLLGLEIVDEVDIATDMQALARQRWRLKAQRLGLTAEDESRERDAVIRLGLTGRRPPEFKDD